MIISSSLARVTNSPGHPHASRRQPPLLFNPLVWMALSLLDLNKVRVKGCFAKHPVFDVNHRGSLLFNATPNRVSRDCLIETIMRSARSGIEHEAAPGNQSCLCNKKVKDY